MKFIGRKYELKKLQTLMNRENQQNALIYGRRRVGKSELIKQALKQFPGKTVYYECKQTTEENNVESLAEIIAERYEFPKPAFRSMEETLEFLFRRASGENLILVLDEYPYLREIVKGLDSVFQSLIDRYREKSNLKVILCGSYIDVMKSLLEEQNPLFGRIDLTIRLEPMDYYDSSLFYPDFTDEDKVRLYSVFGGIPYYNRMIDGSLNVRENIMELIASPGARLENEIGMYLKSELSKINNANEVFEALAKGYSRFSDILSQSHVSSSPALAAVLEKLAGMQLVVRTAPINDERNRKKAGYFINDNLALFFYKYIFRYSSQMNVMDADIFYDRYIKEDFENTYVPERFEHIAAQYLIRMNRRGLLKEPFEKIGRYYYDDPKTKTNGEFDVVTEDRKGYIFYEVKFRERPLTESMIQKEIGQVNQCGLKCRAYGFISRSGFAEDVSDSGRILIQLSDLYRDI